MYTHTHTHTHTHTYTHTTGPIGKPPPPKVLNSRIRTESLSTLEQNKETSKKGASDSDKSDLLRSTSEENIVAAVSNVKGKGQNKSGGGGFFSRTGAKVANTPKEPPPPKKPARSWLRGGKDKGSPQMKRPMSALMADVSERGRENEREREEGRGREKEREREREREREKACTSFQAN